MERIRRDGPLTFYEFMQAALYDPELGYYNTERLKIGPAGDYYTSSNVHPAFGALLARAFAELWQQVSDQPDLTIVELGAGTGQLAHDILTAIREERPEIFEQLSYVIVEASPAMRRRQREMLAAFDDLVVWRDLKELEWESESTPLDAISFSNELFDAMPVHRVRSEHGQLEEAYVAVERERLALIWDEPSTDALAGYLNDLEINLTNGQVAEINLDAVALLGRLSKLLSRGFLVTIDYGDVAAHLYGPDRRKGTLRSFYRHSLTGSPLERPGEQDITASVNFTALIEYGKDFGFERVSYERQTAFLMRMGLVEKIADRMQEDTVDDLQERLALKNLFVPGGVSDNFRVLIQRKL